MTLKELIQSELGEEFSVVKIEVDRDENKGQPGTTVKLHRRATAVPVTVTNEWFFAEVNKMSPPHMVAVMRSYLIADKR